MIQLRISELPACKRFGSSAANQPVSLRRIASTTSKASPLRDINIDIVYITGHGFPARHGGPMFYADRIGLAAVYEDIKRLHAQYGYWWQPAPHER